MGGLCLIFKVDTVSVRVSVTGLTVTQFLKVFTGC